MHRVWRDGPYRCEHVHGEPHWSTLPGRCDRRLPPLLLAKRAGALVLRPPRADTHQTHSASPADHTVRHTAGSLRRGPVLRGWVDVRHRPADGYRRWLSESLSVTRPARHRQQEGPAASGYVSPRLADAVQPALRQAHRADLVAS